MLLFSKFSVINPFFVCFLDEILYYGEVITSEIFKIPGKL